MTELPAPLVPSEVDLRDFDYMPFLGEKMFTSDTWMLCDADEKVAALRLWWKSWHQEPAGSLPDNDRLLSELAGYGVAVKAFQAVKENAMRGWVKCSDGRLYHPVVASLAIDTWGKRKKIRADNQADRERKRRKRGVVRVDSDPETAWCPVDKQHMSGGQIENSAGQNAPEPVLSGGSPADNELFPPPCPADKRKIPPENALKGREEESPLSPPLPETEPATRERRATRLPDDWSLPDDWRDWAKAERPDVDVVLEAAKFRDHWHGKGGKDGRKVTWEGTWRNWIRNARSSPRRPPDTPLGGGYVPMGNL